MKSIASCRRWLLGLQVALVALLVVGGVQLSFGQLADDGQHKAVAIYREPSPTLVGILKEFLSDIDWQAIANAREQVEKFIKKVERLISLFKSNPSSSAARDQSVFSSRWWSGGSGATGETADSTSVKAALERVACFVGYMRLLNHSNEALAELDASKVVSNLFGASKVAAGDSAGYLSKLFG